MVLTRLGLHFSCTIWIPNLNCAPIVFLHALDLKSWYLIGSRHKKPHVNKTIVSMLIKEWTFLFLCSFLEGRGLGNFSEFEFYPSAFCKLLQQLDHWLAVHDFFPLLLLPRNFLCNCTPAPPPPPYSNQPKKKTNKPAHPNKTWTREKTIKFLTFLKTSFLQKITINLNPDDRLFPYFVK